MAGMSSLTSTVSTRASWTAQNNLTGVAYTPVSVGPTITKQFNLGTAVANNASGGADEVFSFQQAIAGAGSATIDLFAMTNQLQQTAVGISRIKALQFRLLNAADDSTIAAIVLGSGLTLALTVTSTVITGVSIGAAGSGYPVSVTFPVAPIQASGSGGIINVTTNSSGVPTSVAIVNGGSGYAAATVPSTQLISATVTNFGPAVPAPLDFQTQGGGLTLTLTVGATIVTAVAIGAAGADYPPSACLLVSPQQTGGSGCCVSVITNASGVPTTVALVAGQGGTGYTAATVPCIVIGYFTLYSGGAHMYFDVLPTGFCAIYATSRNIKIYNNDPSNTATVEISVIGATT